MSADSPQTVQQAYEAAFQAYSNGNLQQSEQILLGLVKEVPQFPGAHHLLSIINMQAGRMDIAAKAMEYAIKLQPQNAGFLTNATEIFRKAGQLDRAVEVGRAATALEPGNAAAHSNLGIAFYDQENLVEAEASQRRAVALNSEFVPALNNLGSIARDSGDRDKAIEFYGKAHNIAPENPEPANNLASTYLENEQVEEAKAILVEMVKVAPRSPELQRNMGRVALIEANLDVAENCFRAAITLKPDQAENYLGLAQTLMEKNHPLLAQIEVETALRLDPESAQAYMQMGSIKSHLGDVQGGIASHMRAIELKPEMSQARIALGHMYIELGDFDAARDAFNQAKENSKEPLGPLLSLARLDKMTADNPIVAELEEQRERVMSAPASSAAGYFYGMGKVYEDLKDFEKAFADYAMGAAKKRSSIEYDPDNVDRLTDKIIETFTPKFMEALQEHAIASDQSVFVVGMPRSGTTLTESIISAHSKAFGAGERHDLQHLFGPGVSNPDKDVVDMIKGFAPRDLKRKAEEYESAIKSQAGGALRVVDKMPANFQLVGLVHALMPNAKIIHTARNPFDTCLSCFTHLFERSQLHSYDLVELGRYFNAYVRVMNHWNDVLPKGRILTSHYEDLVEDIDDRALKLIDHVDLEWEEACLEFHKQERRVRTASVTQVRQPIYKTSKEKWRRYEEQLKPLIDVIGDNRIKF